MIVVTRFSPGQPVIYDGAEHRVSGLDFHGFETHRVERYFLDDNTINVDVSHLLEIEVDEPGDDDVLVDAHDNMRWRGWRISGWPGEVLHVMNREEGLEFFCRTVHEALLRIWEETT
jgi:hypothetical protein